MELNAKSIGKQALWTAAARALLSGLLMFGWAPAAHALDPDRFISQYGHTSWRYKDGELPPAGPIAQTADGYIWLGTSDGLMRFDGVRFTRWQPPQGQALPSSRFGAMLGTPDGSLWVGTSAGMARIKDGQLTSFASAEGGGGVAAVISDETGAVWFTRYGIKDGKGPLCRVQDGEMQCFGKEDGIPVSYGLGLRKDSEGNFWFGSSALCRWRPGAQAALYFADELKGSGGVGVIDVAKTEGTAWASLDAVGPGLGVRHESEGVWSTYVIPGFDGARVRAQTLYADGDDNLWLGTTTEGLYRIHGGVADRFGMQQGLTGGEIGHIFEDRERNIWVQTDGGVDMFRDMPVVTYSLSEGLTGASAETLLVRHDGSVWIGRTEGVDILRYGNRAPVTGLSEIGKRSAAPLLEDRSGRVWLTVGDELMVYDRQHLSEVKGPLGPAEGVWAMTEDADGVVWAGTYQGDERHLLKISGQTVEEDISLDAQMRRPSFMAADAVAGIWIASDAGQLVHYRNGEMEAVPLGDGGMQIAGLANSSDGALWVLTSTGLYSVKNGRVSLLDGRNGLPCLSVISMLQDAEGNYWLFTRCGILAIPAADIAAWQAEPESKVSVKAYDALDGALPSPPSFSTYPRSGTSPDGRLWFLAARNVQMIDPRRTYRNSIAPPVRIEGLIADHKPHDPVPPVELRPRGELEIDYAALSYTVPRKVNFRYRLEGHDDEWTEAGTRRQAVYSELSPGSYRFMVVAGNNSGVWNDTGATLEFTILPAWYQTNIFRLACLLAIGLIVWTIYRLRIRQVSRSMAARMDERIAERTRLARDLHDTFIQTIQGSRLVAEDALEKADDPVYLRRAMKRLSDWLEQANEESRAALSSLRATATQKNDLADALRRAAAACDDDGRSSAVVTVTGNSKEMHPAVRDEVYRIAYEAIRNACRHAEAGQVTIELRYSRDLVLLIKDDGVGIRPDIIANGREGHFGMTGMRERAHRIGAKLAVKSSPGNGTEVRLIVPGGLAFHEPTDSPR